MDCLSSGERTVRRARRLFIHSALPPSRRSRTAVAFQINQPENKAANYARLGGFFMDVEDLCGKPNIILDQCWQK